jgi:hypothetical protein
LLYGFEIISFTSVTINLSAVGEDLGSTKQKLGGRRIVKKCMRSTMLKVQTNHQLLARQHVDQREACPLLLYLSS